MSPTPSDASSSCGPYRVALPLPVPPPPSRAHLVASYVLSACALLATLSSLHVASTLSRVVSMSACPRRCPVPSATPAPAVVAPMRVMDAIGSASVHDFEPARPTALRGLRALGRGVYVVPRGSLDEALSAQRPLARRTVILPESRDGRVVGVRVYGIRRGDTLAALGFADGDVILRVNGVEIASPDRCLEAYARLRRADRVTVTFERRGRPRSHVYAIVEGA
jgi:general secretion pathway protein C